MERKLTAILSADVQGYSRLMGTDEEGTLRTLTAYRAADRYLPCSAIGPVSSGQRAIACWPSSPARSMPYNAPWPIQQRSMAENTEFAALIRRMEFRIGVNLGDVSSRGRPDLWRWGQYRCTAGRLSRTRRHLHLLGTVYEHNQEQAGLTI